MHLAGELDVDTTPQLEQTLREPDSQAQLVVLDMRELAFMDAPACTPSSTPARARGSSAAGSCSCAGPPDVDRVFSLTGNAADVESGDLDPVEPSVQALLRLGDEDGPS